MVSFTKTNLHNHVHRYVNMVMMLLYDFVYIIMFTCVFNYGYIRNSTNVFISALNTFSFCEKMYSMQRVELGYIRINNSVNTVFDITGFAHFLLIFLLPFCCKLFCWPFKYRVAVAAILPSLQVLPWYLNMNTIKCY